jgi:rod shape-determining protein MreD
MGALRVFAGLVAAAILHFVGVELFEAFPRAVDLFLLVAVLEARRGQPAVGMLAGLAAGLLTDGITGGPYGLFGFADTAVAYGVAAAARQLVVQRTTSLAALFAAAAAAQQALVAGLALVFRPGAELAAPEWLLVRVATTAVAGLVWIRVAELVLGRFASRRASRKKKLADPR